MCAYLTREGDALKPAVDPGHGHVSMGSGQLFEGVQSLQEEVGNLFPQQLVPGTVAVHRLSGRGHNEVSLQCTAQLGSNDLLDLQKDLYAVTASDVANATLAQAHMQGTSGHESLLVL